MKRTTIRAKLLIPALLMSSLFSVVNAEPVLQSQTGNTNPFLSRTFKLNNRTFDEVLVPGSPPPPNYYSPGITVPPPNLIAGINSLNNVPAFSWCYGCAPTSAAMMMGYYDNHGYPNIYTGPANGGVCPLNNDLYWGHEECPISASHIGKDGRVVRGYVEDYWIAYLNNGSDPYIVNGWAEHNPLDCTADFMGTGQSKYGNPDGWTSFMYGSDNSRCSDFIGLEPSYRDACHGMKLFANSRGYAVTTNYSQYIYGYNGFAAGFSYSDYKAEIDAGWPVMIHLEGHMMVGFGYNDAGNIIYVHDTWDNNDHSMAWGGSYTNMAHYGVTVLHLQSVSAGTVQFKSATYSVAENGGTVRIFASRTGGSAGAVSANYATANGTAVAGSDYTSKAGTLSWTNGDAADKYTDITIVDDTDAENAETFAVTLTGISGAALGSPTATVVTITGPNDQPPAPANDNFANAATLAANSGTISSNNTMATTETGEPAHAGYGPNRSIWYKFTPSSNGTFAVDTHGSSFDTVLAVYTGSAVSSLGAIASNDQDGSANGNSGLTGISLTGSVTYRIAVAGANASASGTTLLNWSFSPTIYCTVTFDAQGGTTPSPTSKVVISGSTYGTLATTSRTGYNFAGWWTGAGGSGVEITASTTVSITTAQTLYAKWVAVSVITLGAALDNTNLVWTTGGTSNWYGQTVVTYDGVDAAQSGAINNDQTNWIQTTVTGPGVLWFWWRVSSEENYDYLVFYYDGYMQVRISGTTNGWFHSGWTIPAGVHTLKWAYAKDYSAIDGSDCGWVDQVTWTPSVVPSVTLSIGGASMAEAGGICTVTASLSAVSAQAVTVNLSFSGTAVYATDYTRSATSIVIAAGSTYGTMTLTSIQDAYMEGSETIVVDIDSVANGTENGTQQVTASIVDDDAPACFYHAVQPGNGSMIICWSSLTNQKYSIYCTTNLMAGFTVLRSNIVASSSINSYTDLVTTAPFKYWMIKADP